MPEKNLKIITIENKQDEKFLRKKTIHFDFSKMDKKELAELIKNMRKMMTESNGVGLSANQIGLNMQLFVAQLPSSQINTDKKTDEHGYNIHINTRSYKPKSVSDKFYAIFNPEIIKFSDKKISIEEGCLSVPGLYGVVERPEKITITGQDKNARKIKIKVVGMLARVFQHETDHLNGILFIDKCDKLYKMKDIK